jgi:CBS-domain-containing membrane protein
MAQDASQASLTAGPRRRRRQLSVADAMLARPTVHGPSATVGELRAFFADDHVHAALLVDDGRLVGVVDRTDLASTTDDDAVPRQCLNMR